MVFNEYAAYYDLLYHDKDYSGECAYIQELLKKYAITENRGGVELLDLGCGTGRHAELMSVNYGYNVQGVDMSADMLEVANKRTTNNNKLNFIQGRLQDFNVAKTFDVILALFHVMSYQTTNQEIIEALQNIHSRLQSDGLFIFDCWYGPAVLWQRPSLRVKRMENDMIKVTRIAEPLMRENDNIVEVHYDLFIEDKIQHRIRELREVHTMRYFFFDEVVTFLHSNGFKLIDSFEFMTNKPLSSDTWGSCFVVAKR